MPCRLKKRARLPDGVAQLFVFRVRTGPLMWWPVAWPPVKLLYAALSKSSKTTSVLLLRLERFSRSSDSFREDLLMVLLPVVVQLT